MIFRTPAQRIYNDSFPKIPAVAISTKDAEWLSLRIKKENAAHGFFQNQLPDAAGCTIF